MDQYRFRRIYEETRMSESIILGEAVFLGIVSFVFGIWVGWNMGSWTKFVIRGKSK